MALTSLLERSRARSSALTALLTELVEIESPSTEPAGVARLAERLQRELQGLGLETVLDPVAGGGPLLIGYSPSARTAPPVLLLGHTDTVWPIGTLARRPVRIDGERLHGPGSFDMKAGLVIAVEALRLLSEQGPLPPVQVLFTSLEETGCGPYRERLLGALGGARACLDFEPAGPGGAVKTARKGAATFNLQTRGRAAHAGANFSEGRNAILELARKLIEASALTDLARGITVNVGVIQGGLRPNVVPDQAGAEIDVRYRTLADGQELERRLRELSSGSEGVSLELTGTLGHPPLERTPEVAALYSTAREVADELGLPLDEVAVGGASEAAFATALRLPTLDGLGAAGDGAHAEHEHVLLASLPERAALTAALIARLTTNEREVP